MQRTGRNRYLRLDSVSTGRGSKVWIKGKKKKDTSSGDCLGNFAACEAYDMLSRSNYRVLALLIKFPGHEFCPQKPGNSHK